MATLVSGYLAKYGQRAAGALVLLLSGWLLQRPDGVLGAGLVSMILALTASGLIVWRLLSLSGGSPGAASDRVTTVILFAAGAGLSLAANVAGDYRMMAAFAAAALLALGVTAAVFGRTVAGSVAVPVLVLYVAVPMLPLSEAVLSFPMRRLCTLLAALLLSLGTRDVSLSGTEIYFGDLTVSVTSACDGLTLLQNLAWIAWWTVLLHYRGFWTRLSHGLVAVPAVIVANTLRIVLLALWASVEGPEVLASAGHLYIAWAAVALATALFLSLEGLLSAGHSGAESKPSFSLKKTGSSG